MSRVGKLPIEIPVGVEVAIDKLSVNIKGPKGEISKKFAGKINIEKVDNTVVVSRADDSKEAKAMWGTARSIINNMVTGVTTLFKEELEVNGVGYRAAVQGKFLNLSLGKSHNTKIEIPEGLNVVAPKPTILELEAVDKQLLGHFASLVIKQRPPEPYKGKGIKKKGQYVQRKEGKKG